MECMDTYTFHVGIYISNIQSDLLESLNLASDGRYAGFFTSLTKPKQKYVALTDGLHLNFFTAAFRGTIKGIKHTLHRETILDRREGRRLIQAVIDKIVHFA